MPELKHEDLPQAGTVWRHVDSGAHYRVMGVANWYARPYPDDKFPLTVIYANAAGQIWSRPIDRWEGRFTQLNDAEIITMAPQRTELPATPAESPDKWATVAMCIGMFAEIAHAESVARGWYHDPVTGAPKARNIGEMLALVHSEVSEALEGDRKLRADDHLPHLSSTLVELGDAFIRLGDLAIYICELDRYKERFGAEAMDIGRAVAEKMAYNAIRADHSLEARKAAGGKAY